MLLSLKDVCWFTVSMGVLMGFFKEDFCLGKDVVDGFLNRGELSLRIIVGKNRGGWLLLLLVLGCFWGCIDNSRKFIKESLICESFRF